MTILKQLKTDHLTFDAPGPWSFKEMGKLRPSEEVYTYNLSTGKAEPGVFEANLSFKSLSQK